MRIYIDEGGTFHVPVGSDYLLSVVAALVIPASREASLFYEFMRLRDCWGISAIEIKGRELDEGHFAAIIDVLNSHDVVLEFLAIDMAWHTESGLTEFKQSQARKVIDSLTPDHQPTLVAEVKELSQSLAGIPNQLFVQAYLTIELVKDRDVQWLEENIVFPKRPGEPPKIVDMKKVLQESFRFADSENDLGLHLADIAASACRRAFNGNLQQSGWKKLGRLLVKKDGKPPIIGLSTPEQAVGRDRRLHAGPAQAWLTLDSAAKSMWP